ncbi:MxaK protein [Methylococcus sp. EFPC2]|uniref:MxaK protein n=1 Tax=Methylococcus sp. EFPC2 TaxID=2812648 RepID=UPI0019681C6E|nr:MxaK protein [Methylococcus sp. EFPC2]QSA97378.1 MxaK protein [Methylococcus sp. EFPC2]
MRLLGLRWFWLAAAALFLMLAVYSSVRIYRLNLFNADLAVLSAGNDLPVERRFGAEAPVLLARAAHLASLGRYDDALDIYARVSDSEEVEVRQAALYDLGNLQLRRAAELAEKLETRRAVPLLELAKAAYRGALALDPGDWDAKYNLEFAMRLLPEMARRNSGGDETPPEEETRRNWTTLPGFPRGLP